MKSSRIRSLFVKTTIAFLMLSLAAPLTWGGVDVYLIYSGKNKAEKKALMKALPKNIKVKAYNADLLAVADYSGIQKAVSKFEKAGVIVVLRDRPLQLLKGATVSKDLIIVNSKKQGLKSSRWTIYLLDDAEDLSPFGADAKRKTVTNMDDLKNKDEIRSSDVLIVDEQKIQIQKVVSYLVGQSLVSRPIAKRD